MSPLESIFEALNRAGVRYVVVGGVAVVLHGFARVTGDLDLVIDLDPPAARRAIEALLSLGLRPRVPVDALAFADAGVRASWVRDKRMRVFTMLDPANALRQVDLFAEHPLPFEDLWARAEVMTTTATTVHVAAIPDLIAMKHQAGRPRDRADIEALREVLRRREGA